MTITWQAVVNFTRNAASLAAIVLGAIPQTDLPTGVRAALVGAGAVIQAIEHWANTQASQAPPAPSTPVVTASTTSTAPAPATITNAPVA